MPRWPEDHANRFHAGRLIAARQRRGLGVAELADAVGLERHAIGRYEAGLVVPLAGQLKRIARRLEVPERFFGAEGSSTVTPGSLSLGNSAGMRAELLQRVLGAAAFAAILNHSAERFLALPDVSLPDYSGRAPAHAAELLRVRWDLGRGLIARPLAMLEARGVRVYSLPPDVAGVGAFSFWHAQRPFILLPPHAAGQALRTALSNELGQLVLHRDGMPGSRAAMHAAAQFAEAFLLPAEAVARIGPDPCEDAIAVLAAQFGVDPIMAARRLHWLGKLTDWKFRALRTRLAQLTGGAALAPTGAAQPADETSTLLPRVFAALRARGISKLKLAKVLGLYTRDLDELSFGMATQVMTGAMDGPDALPRLGPGLRLVAGGNSQVAGE